MLNARKLQMNLFTTARIRRPDPHYCPTGVEAIIDQIERRWSRLLWLPIHIASQLQLAVGKRIEDSDDGRDLDDIMQQYLQRPNQNSCIR